VKASGADMLRVGVYKPRTSPHDFRGRGLEGLVLCEARLHEYADMLQISSRNMQNYPLLTEVGKFGRPVLLKRGMAASLCELQNATRICPMKRGRRHPLKR
jgi:3-deoxy-7-phosphoheptulonate synthase